MKPQPIFYDINRDGVTQGLLNMWKNCREQAWLFLQGWTPKKTSMSLTFGTVIHAILEIIYGQIQKGKIKTVPNEKTVRFYIKAVEKIWHQENPRADKELLEHKELSFLLAEAIMPIYFEFWHKDITEMKWMGVEQQFSLPWEFPDGFKTILKGKMDGLYKKHGIWLFETKAKSRIDEGTLMDVLPLDFQNLFYLACIRMLYKIVPSGIRYNIIRRTQMEQRKDESIKAFSNRIIQDIRKRPDYYFIRYEISLSVQELDKFLEELVAQVREFRGWWEEKLGHYRNPQQCETKYGRCWALGICSGPNYNLYEKRKQVFRELEDY